MKRCEGLLKKQMGDTGSTQDEEKARKKSKGLEEKMKSNELLVVKKTSQTTTAGSDIPIDLIIDNILFKIPPQFIHESFRYVSKQFNNFVSTPEFAHQNFAYSKPKFILHCDSRDFPRTVPTYEMENGEFVPSGSISRSGNIINSCKGLLLIQTGITFQVTNPITKKIVSLPDCPSNCEHKDFCLRFLAFDSSSNLFKVIHRSNWEDDRFEIWSLGVDKAWRKVHPFPPLHDHDLSPLSYYERLAYFFTSIFSDTVCIRGKIHWFVPLPKLLISFDVSDETGQLTDIPPTGKLDDEHDIMEMGGYLAYIATARSGTTIDIWMLKDLKRGEWIHRHTIVAGSFPEPNLLSFTPFLSTNKGIILQFRKNGMLYSYDITSGWLKKLKMVIQCFQDAFLVHRDSLISWDAPDK